MKKIDLVWPSTIKEAEADQLEMRRHLITSRLDGKQVGICLAIGVAYSPSERVAIATGVPMLLSGHPISGDPMLIAEAKTDFPYVPGLFAYREGPAIAKLLNSFSGQIDLLVFRSQGIAHPRGFGLATHLGVLAETPSIGITSKRLWGSCDTPPLDSMEPNPLHDDQGTVIGYVKRVAPFCKPIFASPGHLTDLPFLKEFLSGITEIQKCFPSGLTVAQEAANAHASSLQK